jgi:hypothetical protein
LPTFGQIFPHLPICAIICQIVSKFASFTKISYMPTFANILPLTNIWPHLPNCAHIFPHLPKYVHSSWYSPTCANSCLIVSTFANICPQLSIFTDIYLHVLYPYLPNSANVHLHLLQIAHIYSYLSKFPLFAYICRFCYILHTFTRCCTHLLILHTFSKKFLNLPLFIHIPIFGKKPTFTYFAHVFPTTFLKYSWTGRQMKHLAKWAKKMDDNCQNRSDEKINFDIFVTRAHVKICHLTYTPYHIAQLNCHVTHPYSHVTYP